MLKTAFVKPTNEIYTRHELATKKQTSGESVDQFLHSLKFMFEAEDSNLQFKFVDGTASEKYIMFLSAVCTDVFC